jgi:hypothetical protein
MYVCMYVCMRVYIQTIKRSKESMQEEKGRGRGQKSERAYYMGWKRGKVDLVLFYSVVE